MLSRLRRFLIPPLFESEEKNRAARFLNSLAWSSIALLLAFILIRIVFFSENTSFSLLIIGLVVLTLSLVQILVRLGYVREASLFLVIGSWLLITYHAWNTDGIRETTPATYLVICLLASFLLGWRATLVTAIMSIAAIWGFAILEKNGILRLHLGNPLNYARDLTIVFLLTGALVYSLINNLNRSLYEARLELKERLRADEKLQRQAQYLTALHETTLGLINHLELRPLLESILTRACDLAGTEHGLLELVLPDGSALRQELGQGVFSKFDGNLTPKNSGVTGNVWAGGKSMTVQNYAEWEKSIPAYVAAEIRAVMGIPLISGDRIIGVLAFAHVKEGQFFTTEHIGSMERFAALASLAMDNARLFEQAQNELKERRATEIALRASEERFRKIFHASPVAICITSLDKGRLLDANPAYWNLSGRDANTSLNKTVQELGIWADPQEYSNFFEQLKRTRSISEPDYQFKTRTGETKSTVAFHELVQLGEEASVLSMFYDVTLQKQAQSALLASEERFRKVFQTSQMAICITTLDEGHFVDANDAFWELSGLKQEDSFGTTALELGIWATPQEGKDFAKKLLENRSLKYVNREFAQGGGDHRSTFAFYELIYLKDQLCVLAMFYDVTPQRKVQEALYHSEARTRALLNAIPDMIFEFSQNGVFLNFIPPKDAQPTLAPEQFLGKNLKDLFPLEIASQTLFAIGRALETDQLHAFEYSLPVGEEMHFFEARVVSVSSESALMMVRDISQRKWVETEREELINELEQKNAELERFTYTVSHDLKSPLITIKGFLGFLEKDAASGNIVRLRSDIERIADATDKMQTLLNELLQLSRIGRLMNPPQKIPFAALVSEAVELVQGRLRERGIHMKIQKDLPAVNVDHQRLVEVIQNLVDNAAKFMGDQPEPCIEIGAHTDQGGNPIFFVKDNGIGIAPEHHERVFGLFNKLDVNSDGTGIGLALVKRIIEVHGGRIWVESEAGKGATFYFTLGKG